MDSLIRRSFHLDPEAITDQSEYAKLYGQAKYSLDYTSIAEARSLLNG